MSDAWKDRRLKQVSTDPVPRPGWRVPGQIPPAHEGAGDSLPPRESAEANEVSVEFEPQMEQSPSGWGRAGARVRGILGEGFPEGTLAPPAEFSNVDTLWISSASLRNVSERFLTDVR